MSDWLTLAVVAAVLYFIECTAWIHAGLYVCYRTALSTSWRAASGHALLGNERGVVILVDPLRLSGNTATCHAWPICISPDGVTNVSSDGRLVALPQPGYVDFDDIDSIRAQFGDVEVNGQVFARVGSSVLAASLASHLYTVWKQAPKNRQRAIDRVLAASFDERAAAGRWSLVRGRTRLLVAMCASLFAFLFLATPLAVLLLGPERSWAYLLVGIFGLTLAIAVRYFRVHRSLFPDAVYDRWVSALSMLLFPPAAIRCVDKLSREALTTFHCIVVTPTVCGAAAVPLVRRVYFDVVVPEPPHQAAPKAEMCAAWFRRRVREHSEAALRRLSLDLTQAPARDDESVAFYCPRCHAQFSKTDRETCPDCSAIKLLAFDAVSSGSVSVAR